MSQNLWTDAADAALREMWAQRLTARQIAVMAQGGAAGGDWLVWDGRHWDLDGGPAGAALLAQRVDVSICMAPDGEDFNDVLRASLQ